MNQRPRRPKSCSPTKKSVATRLALIIQKTNGLAASRLDSLDSPYAPGL